jgi:hypothetical protein
VFKFRLYHHRGKPLFELAKKRNVEDSRYVADRNGIRRNIAENLNYGKQNRKIRKEKGLLFKMCIKK